MDTSKVIEAIGAAAAATKPGQEYCFLWIDWWPMCMTKSEWSGWMQAIGAVFAIGGMFTVVLFQQHQQSKLRKKAALMAIASTRQTAAYLAKRIDTPFFKNQRLTFVPFFSNAVEPLATFPMHDIVDGELILELMTLRQFVVALRDLFQHQPENFNAEAFSNIVEQCDDAMNRFWSASELHSLLKRFDVAEQHPVPGAD